MSEIISALPGARYSGMIDQAEAGPRGMVTLRGDLASPDLVSAVKKVTGAAMPDVRRVSAGKGGKAAAWMSPDELLIFGARDEAPAMAQSLEKALAGQFATVADVSDARAVFTLTGARVRDVLAKACPVDFADFPVGTVRRTRAAQVAAAVWRHSDDGFTVICFRSVGNYMWDLLSTLSRPGGEVALYR